MPNFMTDNILLSYISMFFSFSSTIHRVFVTFPAYVWILSNKDYEKKLRKKKTLLKGIAKICGVLADL